MRTRVRQALRATSAYSIVQRILLMPARRALLWRRVLRVFRGGSMGDTVGLILSAIDDVVEYTLKPDSRISPRARFVRVVRMRSSPVVFQLRPGTDDLYNVLPGREGDVHDAILGPLREGDVLIDVGANVGYYTVLGSKRVGPTGRVVAIEPIPSTIALLKRNIAANGCHNVDVVEMAVWSLHGVRVSVRVPSRFFGQAAASAEPTGAQRCGCFWVETTTLDRVCAPFGRIRVLKLDTEGSEFEILKGADAALEKADIVVAEASSHADEILHLLRAKGFEVREMRFSSYIMACKD